MSHSRILISLLALTIGAPVLAQTAKTDTTTPPAVDCPAQFTAMDTDKNGMLSETEAPQIYARSRVNDAAIGDQGYAQDQYMTDCAANTFVRQEPEAGAPFDGANSFTEDQAKDRAMAWGLSTVSAMTKDDKGIWRGTAVMDGANVSVAVDYKGNVVTTTN